MTEPSIDSNGNSNRDDSNAGGSSAGFFSRLWREGRRQAALLYDIGAVYGIHFANQALPLVTVPYLSRVLGPAGWGLVAMAQAFGVYGNLVVDYGFVYSATREIATAEDKEQVEGIIAGVSGAKLLLSAAALGAAFCAYAFVPLFREHPLLLWTAMISEIIKALLPVYYFYGIQRVAIASLLDISARTAAAIGIFVFVHSPSDGWKVFALNGATAAVTLVIGYALVTRRYALRMPRLAEGWRMLREGWAMFLFRSAHTIYTAGNAFVLGLFAPPRAVGYYAGAEKISTAAVGLLAPLTTVLYPRAAALVKTSLLKAAKVTRVTFYLTGACAAALGLILWIGAPLIVRILLGRNFGESEGVLRILSIRAPLIAWTNTLGFQWLLVLGLERQFQKITIAALLLNLALATALAPRFSYDGMAWAVLVSQAAAAFGILIVLNRRALNPFSRKLTEADA
ncbi:MAG TPA: oligosaccharide flippase family protein [Bryobacteraceae bacterium]|nr:oligosaccharide flippase family protein [Bryobacteraceae bacterium]